MTRTNHLDNSARNVGIVTGAASGIGAAIAAELRSRGWLIAGFDLSPAISDFDVIVDMSDFGSVLAGVEKVVDALGPINAAVSAAGYYEMFPIASISKEKWERMLAVHLGGAFNLAQAVVPEMITRRAGSFIGITSELAIGGGGEDVHYASAKGAIIGFIRSLAVELAPHRVRVNGVAPGPTDTPLLTAESPWRAPEYLATLPSRSLAKPEDIALVVAHLIEEATFTTGEIISPNSGAVI